VAINCSALPESILERELFGHAKGAYTGAHEAKEGYFQAAGEGTLFLDEVSGLSPATQAKLLRAIEEKRIYRLGDPKPVDVSARVLAASNRDPKKAVEDGSLREDLYFRLNVVAICLPPLRERKEDIAILASHFLKRFSERYGKPTMSMSPEAMKLLYSYEWPGNVRELENVIEKAVVLAEGESSEIRRIALPTDGESSLDAPGPGGYTEAKKRAMQEFEIKCIRSALERAEGSVTDAAKNMGIGRTALQRLLKKYGIKSRGFKKQ
jgi:transcriptional regulator with PAS, ATPase and Fis domain